MAQRFNKTAVLMTLASRQTAAAKLFRERAGKTINANDGWHQAQFKGAEAAAAYGAWRALVDLETAIRSGEVVA